MAEAPPKRTYPVIPNQHWFTLRDRFKRSIPTQLDSATLASILNTQARSVDSNVLPALRQVGLVDSQNKVNQELAARWRDDEQYAEVCRELIAQLYPEGLVHTAPNPTADRAPAERWFANTTKQGHAAVAKMVRFYQLLSDPTIPDAVSPKTASPRAAREGRRANHEAKRPVAPAPAVSSPAPAAPATPAAHSGSPSIHIDIQVHISADAKPDQIEQIFASMAKHLYKKSE